MRGYHAYTKFWTLPEMAKIEANLEIEKSKNRIIQDSLVSEHETTVRALKILENVISNTSGGDKITNKIQINSDKASEAIIRSARGATKITIRNEDFNENEIKEIQSPEVQPEKRYILSGKFRIVQINTEKKKTWKLLLKNNNGEKINATASVFNISQNEEEFKKLFDYQKNETLLDIDVCVSEKSNYTSYEIINIKQHDL